MIDSDQLGMIARWRNRAAECRIDMDALRDPEAKKTLLKIAEVYERLATRTETQAGIKADPHFCRGEAERLLNRARATADYKERGFLISMAQEWVERAKAIDLTMKETSRQKTDSEPRSAMTVHSVDVEV
jgi:hypothetical protein